MEEEINQKHAFDDALRELQTLLQTLTFLHSFNIYAKDEEEDEERAEPSSSDNTSLEYQDAERAERLERRSLPPISREEIESFDIDLFLKQLTSHR